MLQITKLDVDENPHGYFREAADGVNAKGV
jgi:hypothetical protein